MVLRKTVTFVKLFSQRGLVLCLFKESLKVTLFIIVLYVNLFCKKSGKNPPLQVI
mgnify:CR=1 FL=1